MKKYILIYNPLAGDAGFRYRLDYVMEKFQAGGGLVLPTRTARREDTRELVLLAREIGAAGIIVSGGDGTVHEVVNAMFDCQVDIPLGLIPSGTCNDFANYLCLNRELDSCIQTIINGHYQAVDVGKANDRYFLNVASAGLLTSVAHTTNTALKNTLGKIAYYLTGLGELPSFKTLPVRINAEGTIIEDDVFLFLVMNGGTVGSFSKLAPAARVDDGRLDVLVISRCNVPELMGLMVSLLAGNHIHRKNVRYLQARQIFIECEEEVESDLDGELGPRLPLNISVAARTLKLFVNPAAAGKFN